MGSPFKHARYDMWVQIAVGQHKALPLLATYLAGYAEVFQE
jgi:hypothetical protein